MLIDVVEHLVELISLLVARRAAREKAVDARLVARKVEVSAAEDKLRRPYKLVEHRNEETDDLPTERIAILKDEREKAQGAFERARAQSDGQAAIGPKKIAVFVRFMREMLTASDTPARKAYLRTILSAILVDATTVCIVGSRDVLYAAITGTPSADEVVQLMDRNGLLVRIKLRTRM